MRKTILFIAAGLFFILSFAAMTQPALADGAQRKPRSRAKAQRPPAKNDELIEMVRRAVQASEAAREEARQARQQSEALQQQLDRATSELAALRQSLGGAGIAAKVADCGLRIADLKGEVVRLQTTVAGVMEKRVESVPESPQSASGSSGRKPQLEERLALLEEQVEINAAQVKEHAQTKVESDSKFRVRLSGMILANTYLNTADSSVRSAPTRAPSPLSPFASTRRSIGATLRQSIIGLAMEGPRVGGARLSAEGEFDFYAIVSDDFRSNQLGAFRLRTASTRLDWDRTALTIGLRPAMISPLNPRSLASVWYPALSGAGNLWQWRPQFILEHRPQLTDTSELVLQGGVLTPFGETVDSTVIEGGLNYQGRVAYRRNFDVDKKLEFGLAGQAGNRTFAHRRRETTYVVSSDWMVPLGRLELSGEAYFGKANNLGEQSGVRADLYYALSGPITDPATTIRGIHAFGGWSQLSLKARRDLEFNFAFGLEDPRNGDVRSDVTFARRGFSPFFKNQAASANLIYQLRPNFLISVEYRRLWTEYLTGGRRNDHYNLAFGYLF